MKKLLALLLIAALLAPCVLAEEIDLSGLSFDELQALQTRIAKEIVSRPEWKKVQVPIGCYRIGEDIPVGSYSISSDKGVNSCLVTVWGHDVDDYKTNGGLIHNIIISDTENIGKLELQEGWVLKVSSPVIIAPAVKLAF